MFKYFKKHVSRYAEEVAEVLAPTLRTPQEEFKYYWTTVSDLLTNKATGVADADEERDDDDDMIEADKVFQLLDRMLDMLITEDDESDGGMGPCMEFMLQSGVLKQLVHCGQFKWPPGIMGKVLEFFGGLLADIKQTPMIPDKHVYGPIKNLLLVHATETGLVDKNEEAATTFCVALCDKLGQFPGYADFFIQTKQDSADVFLPLAMIQPLLVSSDEATAVAARDCLRILLQMQSPSVDALIVEGGMESAFVVQHFVRLYAALPVSFNGEDVQLHAMEWSENRYDGWKRFTVSKHAETPEDTRNFFEFMDWVHYCDDVMESCSESVAAHLVGDIIARFFVTQVVPHLTQPAEEVAYATTCYVTACVTQISSPSFLRGVASFLIGSPSGYRAAPSVSTTSPTALEASDLVCNLLVQRCDDISDELSAATLHLFSRLLRKRDDTILDALIIKYATKTSPPPVRALQRAMQSMSEAFTAEMPANLRTDQDSSSYKEHFIDAQAAILESRRTAKLVNRLGKASTTTTTLAMAGGGGGTASTSMSTSTPPADGVEDVEDEHDEGPNFDDDGEHGGAEGAGRQGVDGGEPGAAVVENNGGEPDSAAAGDAAPADTGSHDDVVEMNNPCTSPFLQVLARKLRQLPTQPHSLNLLITANYVALLEVSDHVLQEILLTPTEHSLFSAFSAVCQELRSKSARIDNVEARLGEEREKLATLLQAETMHQMSKSLQAMIVLEEFSKEIAARLLVQCNEILLDT
eukprot:m.18421 g.18421  ORF g.18421 m.18421 type:complete len:751 (+) comp3590_c0_seq1:95-2347(+)